MLDGRGFRVLHLKRVEEDHEYSKFTEVGVTLRIAGSGSSRASFGNTKASIFNILIGGGGAIRRTPRPLGHTSSSDLVNLSDNKAYVSNLDNRKLSGNIYPQHYNKLGKYPVRFSFSRGGSHK